MGSTGLALLSALTWGTTDFLGGVAARRVDVVRVVVWSQVAGLVLALVLAPALGGDPRGTDLLLGAAAGVAGVVGLVFLYRGLATGASAVVAPVSGVVSAVVPAVIGLGVGEWPGGLGLAGFVLAVVAVWLATGGSTSAGAGLGSGIVAGLGFGLFFVILAPVPVEAGLWPLVPARVASIAVLVLLMRRRVSGGIPAGSRGVVAAAGLGDMGANALILVALQLGPLGEGAVVSSLFPAVTVVWSAVVLGERVSTTQRIGIVLAVVAMALIAA